MPVEGPRFRSDVKPNSSKNAPHRSEIVIFHSLGREQIAQIVDIQLRNLQQRLADRKLTLELTDDAKTHLAERGYDPVFGARPLKRTIQRMIENPLAVEVLGGQTFSFRRQAPAVAAS